MTDELITVRELEDLLQVDRTTIYTLLKSGQLPGFKVGGQWRFSQQDIGIWLKEQKTGQTGLASSSSDVLPLYYIQSIQDIFAEATSLGSIVTRLNGEPLTRISNPCDFCNFVQSTPHGFQRCVDSWRDLAAKPEKKPKLYACHAGLLYSRTRIKVENQFVAVVFAGQCIIDGQIETFASMIDQVAAACDLNPVQLHNLQSSIHFCTFESAERSMNLLERLGAILSKIGQERLVLLRKLSHIAEITSF